MHLRMSRGRVAVASGGSLWQRAREREGEGERKGGEHEWGTWAAQGGARMSTRSGNHMVLWFAQTYTLASFVLCSSSSFSSSSSAKTKPESRYFLCSFDWALSCAISL